MMLSRMNPLIGPQSAPSPMMKISPTPQIVAPNPSGSAALTVLIELARTAREPWLRSHAYWNLGKAGDDRALLQLLLRLKYETDAEAQTYLTQALAAFGNHATVDGWAPGADGRGVPEPSKAIELELWRRLADRLDQLPDRGRS